MMLNDNKLLLVHIDGLSYRLFNKYLTDGKLKNLHSWVKDHHYSVGKYFPGMPTSTFAYQAKLFYGKMDKVPSFRWYDRKRKVIMSAFLSESVQQIQTEILGEPRRVFENIIVFEGSFSPGNHPQSLAIASTGKKYLYITIKSALSDLLNVFNGTGAKIIANLLTVPLKHLFFWVFNANRVPFQLYPFSEYIQVFAIRMPFFHHRLKKLIQKG